MNTYFAEEYDQALGGIDKERESFTGSVRRTMWALRS